MDDFLTEEDFLPGEFSTLPLDEAILRLAELEDERPSSSAREKRPKEKRKRIRDEDEDEDRSDGPDDDKYSDDDGWLVDDLGGGYVDEDEVDDDNVVTVKDGVKIFGADEAEEEDDGKGSKKKKKKDQDDDDEKEKKPRRRIKTGPRVVLNVDRLRDVRGLAELPNIQRKLRFRGKGHEEEDLSMIMEAMEQWAHRLMPAMKFDDFIKKTEQLGRKKPIKVFVHNIRHNNPLNTIRNGQPDIDFDQLGLESDEEFAFDDDLPPISAMNAEEAFDAMMKETEQVVKQRAAAAAATATTSSMDLPSTSGLQAMSTNQSLDKTITPSKTSTQTMSSQNVTPVVPKTPSTLTEEQRKMIAENARKAAEKRRALSIARSQEIPTS